MDDMMKELLQLSLEKRCNNVAHVKMIQRMSEEQAENAKRVAVSAVKEAYQKYDNSPAEGKEKALMEWSTAMANQGKAEKSLEMIKTKGQKDIESASEECRHASWRLSQATHQHGVNLLQMEPEGGKSRKHKKMRKSRKSRKLRKIKKSHKRKHKKTGRRRHKSRKH